MRYLLLSVLVVCVIGIMIPSVFGQNESQKIYHTKLHDVSFDIPYRWAVTEAAGKQFGVIIEPDLSLEHNVKKQVDASGFIPKVIITAEPTGATGGVEAGVSPAFFTVKGGKDPKILGNYVFENDDGRKAHLITSTQELHGTEKGTVEFKIIQLTFSNSEFQYSIIYVNVTEWFGYEINSFDSIVKSFEIIIDGKMQPIDFGYQPVFSQIIAIPNAFAESQIPIEIISKTHYTSDQVISLTIKVDRYLPNTPFEVHLCKAGYGCKVLPTESFIAGDVFGSNAYKSKHFLSTDIDSALKTGTLHFRLPMNDCFSGDTGGVRSKAAERPSQVFSCNPPGKYEIVAIYGPQYDPVGKESTQFSYSNNLSDEGKKLAKFLVLSKWDIGTSFNFDKPIWGLTPEDLGFGNSLLISEQPEISISKNYGMGHASLDVFIMQFENEMKAKHYHQEISKYAPAGKTFFYNTGGSEFNLHDFSCIREDKIATEAGKPRFDVQSYSCVRNNLLVYVEGSSSAATAAYEPVLEKINESDYFQQLEVPAPPAPTPQQTQQTQQQSKGGGCLIATAAFGSEMAPQVQFLRELRDNTVLQTESGSAFMTGFNQFYYSFSPIVADYERENPAFKEAVKITLTPLLASLTLLQYADIDSESEMLGYGIGVILLNIGMYFVAPAVLIMAVRKRI